MIWYVLLRSLSSAAISIFVFTTTLNVPLPFTSQGTFPTGNHVFDWLPALRTTERAQFL